jgi:hypothetical protein
MRLLLLSAAALISQALPLTAASVNASTAETLGDNVPPNNYFREPAASNFLYAHIIFMVLSWVIALPLGSLNSVRPRIRWKSNLCDKAWCFISQALNCDILSILPS